MSWRVRCYECGRMVDEAEVVRRAIAPLSPIRIDLCPECDRRKDRQLAQAGRWIAWGYLGFFVVGAAILLFGLLICVLFFAIILLGLHKGTAQSVLTQLVNPAVDVGKSSLK